MDQDKQEQLKLLTGDQRARRRSFGIGGAGNIRSVEEATLNELTDANGSGRRRSSVWSNKSTSSSSSSPKLLSKIKEMFGSSPKESSEER